MRKPTAKSRNKLVWSGSILAHAIVTVAVFGTWIVLAVGFPNIIEPLGPIVVMSSAMLGGIFYVIVHETGHALAVRMRGGEVVSVHLGGPPFTAHWRLGGVPIWFGSWWAFGRVEYVSEYETRKDRAFVACAGLAAELPFLALIMFFGLVAESAESQLALIFSGLALTGIFSIVRNGFPRKGKGRIGNDGYEVWQALSGR